MRAEVRGDVFGEACARIDAEYVRLGHQMGWRFLNSPQSTLSPSNPIALITLNPGGSGVDPDHGRESSEAGSAYVVESWGHNPRGEAPLQLQVRRLFGMIAAAQGTPESGNALLHQSLAAYFVPFRSPSFKKLEPRGESLEFARALWDCLFDYLDPRLIIHDRPGHHQPLEADPHKEAQLCPGKRELAIGMGAVHH